MKKVLLMTAMFLALSLSARAEFSYLVFNTMDGTQHSINVQSLSITFADNNLVAQNNESTLSLPLQTVASMSFSNTPSGVADIVADEAVTVFGSDGAEHGSYQSVQHAIDTLPGGVYIIKFNNGCTAKIIVKK